MRDIGPKSDITHIFYDIGVKSQNVYMLAC